MFTRCSLRPAIFQRTENVFGTNGLVRCQKEVKTLRSLPHSGPPSSSTPSDFAIRVTRACLVRVSSWRAEELIDTDSLRLNTPTPTAYPQQRRCSSVRIVHVSECRRSLITWRFSNGITQRRIDNCHEITLYLTANWLISIKCEIPASGEVYLPVCCFDGKLRGPKVLSFRNSRRGGRRS